MKKLFLIVLAVAQLIMSSCSKDNPVETELIPDGKIEIVINDIPYQTDKFLRIPYTIKMWEFENEDLYLKEIIIFDFDTKAELLRLNESELPFIYKNPLDQIPGVTMDAISSYYLSIQIPIPLTSTKPAKISHRFIFKKPFNSKEITLEGGVFSPRFSETPLIISSPVKGKNWVFINQSTLGYHFYVLFFVNGKISRSERFAFDNLRLNDDYSNIYQGDPKLNTSYFNYHDTLYAVADGSVISIKDGRPENNGDAQDVQMNDLDELAGNYIILKIGEGCYAFYCHCAPNTFKVNVGDVIKKGDPIALLGNSGNSTAPHLHFQITDGPDLFFSNGIPFVLKSYTKIGEYGVGTNTPTPINNSMMEEGVVVDFGL
ncbi:MAG: M23 family metallopeptidase [bacterium]